MAPPMAASVVESAKLCRLINRRRVGKINVFVAMK
jgi:hypothetical protein